MARTLLNQSDCEELTLKPSLTAVIHSMNSDLHCCESDMYKIAISHVKVAQIKIKTSVSHATKTIRFGPVYVLCECSHWFTAGGFLGNNSENMWLLSFYQGSVYVMPCEAYCVMVCVMVQHSTQTCPAPLRLSIHFIQLISLYS